MSGLGFADGTELNSFFHRVKSAMSHHTYLQYSKEYPWIRLVHTCDVPLFTTETTTLIRKYLRSKLVQFQCYMLFHFNGKNATFSNSCKSSISYMLNIILL